MVPAVLHNPTNTKKLAFDAPFFYQRVSGYNERFTFTGKERDEETGYGYFGARYMDHELMTMWLSVDPLADKYPSISPYNYCMRNPVKLIDPDGRDTINCQMNIASRRSVPKSRGGLSGHGIFHVAIPYC